MKIAKDAVVSIDYTLTDDKGTVIDSSEGREPLSFIHGHGNIITGLEEALEGQESGSKLEVSITPEKGYGSRDESLVKELKRDQFDADLDVKVGMQFQAKTASGNQMMIVTRFEGDDITVDGNHPLADIHLHFAVEIKEIREATTEELSHGHVHGPGGHHH